MDEGLPIAYVVLDDGVPVYSSDRQEVGTVEHVFAAPSEDIFHGIALRTPAGSRFVAADQISALHEHGVDLKVEASACAGLPQPHESSSAWRLREPGVKPSRWRHLLDELEGKSPSKRDWTPEG